LNIFTSSENATAKLCVDCYQLRGYASEAIGNAHLLLFARLTPARYVVVYLLGVDARQPTNCRWRQAAF